jgi:hypothetical protein
MLASIYISRFLVGQARLNQKKFCLEERLDERHTIATPGERRRLVEIE